MEPVNTLVKGEKKRTGLPDSLVHRSEVSFFYENEVEEESDEEDETIKNAPFVLIQAAMVKGKMENQCEDSYFTCSRGFGVSDGVSGWNDYGFSSDQFSLQLMYNSKKVIEKAINHALKNNKDKISKGFRRNNKSYLSMDNLDIEEEDEEDEASIEMGDSMEDKISTGKSVNSDKDIKKIYSTQQKPKEAMHPEDNKDTL